MYSRENRKMGSHCWAAGGALSLCFTAWHSLLHSAILDRLLLLPANSILCLWRRKKKSFRERRDLIGGRSETGYAASICYSAVAHQGPTLLQAACILSNRCCKSLPVAQRAGCLPPGCLLTGRMLALETAGSTSPLSHLVKPEFRCLSYSDG